MTLREIIPQVDGGTRYLCACPRGHIAVDVAGARPPEVVVTLGYRGDAARRRRDAREALALVEAAIQDAIQDERDEGRDWL